MRSDSKSWFHFRQVSISSVFQMDDQTSYAACCIGDSQGAHMLCVVSTTKCRLIVSSPRGAALLGFHIHVRDQSEQCRQFMLCSVCDHHSDREGGGSDVRKQVCGVVRRCWQEDSAIVKVPLLITWRIITMKSNIICPVMKSANKMW